MLMLLFEFAKYVAEISGIFESFLIIVAMSRKIFKQGMPSVQPFLPSIYKAFGMLFAVSSIMVVLWKI